MYVLDVQRNVFVVDVSCFCRVVLVVVVLGVCVSLLLGRWPYRGEVAVAAVG
jgi:hypothetical protein